MSKEKDEENIKQLLTELSKEDNIEVEEDTIKPFDYKKYFLSMAIIILVIFGIIKLTSSDDETNKVNYSTAIPIEIMKPTLIPTPTPTLEELEDKRKKEEERVKEEEKKRQEEKVRKKSEGVRIGMTKQDVLDSSWGKPEDINRTIYSFGVHEQWCYPNYNYLYFEDGILTSIQN
jgi:hypothetical protein